MACDDSKTYTPIVAWSKKDSTNWNFHPVGPPVDASTFQKLRTSIELAQSSGLLTIRPSLRVSNDGVSWDTPVAIGSQSRSTDGISYGTDFTDMTATTNSKQLVQPGIEAKNTSGTALEMGLVTLKLDLRKV